MKTASIKLGFFFILIKDATSSPQWAEHNTENLGTLQSFGSFTSVPLINRSTGNLLSKNIIVIKDFFTSFNSSHEQGNSRAIFLGSENNVQKSNFQLLSHAQESTQSFYNTIFQAENLFFNPGTYTQQETGPFYNTTPQAGNPFFNPETYIQQNTGPF